MVEDNIKNHLKDFSEQELAYFYKFRFKQQTLKTQKIIEEFLFSELSLSKKGIQKLIIKHKPLGLCRRCGSSKCFSYLVDYYPTNSWSLSYYKKEDFSTGARKKEKIECVVCGYIIFDPNRSLVIGIFKKVVDLIRNR